jgi:hypothetical protein
MLKIDRKKKIEILHLIVMEKLGEALNYKYFEPLEIMKFLYNIKVILMKKCYEICGG